MNLNIRATNTTLTDAMRSAIEQKMSALEKFLKPEDKIHLEIEVDTKHQSGEVFGVEISIQPHGQFAESRGLDMYSALDMVVPKIKDQLIKEKDKKISLRRRLGNMLKWGNN